LKLLDSRPNLLHIERASYASVSDPMWGWIYGSIDRKLIDGVGRHAAAPVLRRKASPAASGCSQGSRAEDNASTHVAQCFMVVSQFHKRRQCPRLFPHILIIEGIIDVDTPKLAGVALVTFKVAEPCSYQELPRT
jgi:hypothetical protein